MIMILTFKNAEFDRQCHAVADDSRALAIIAVVAALHLGSACTDRAAHGHANSATNLAAADIAHDGVADSGADQRADDFVEQYKAIGHTQERGWLGCWVVGWVGSRRKEGVFPPASGSRECY